MRLLETIHAVDGQVLNLVYHQKRLEYSRNILGFSSELILTLDPPKNGEYRCRVLYENTIEEIEYIPYQKRKISSFKLIHSDLDYPLKYENRDEINLLLEQREKADEIIIIKNGLITDTSIANLCFYDGQSWLTPKHPLLHGTTRQRLLDEGKIKCADIHYKDIHNYSRIAVMNAMTDFCIIEDAIIL